LIQLYRGFIRIFSNSTGTLEGGLAMMEDKEKEQVAGLELQQMFVLCGNSALRTHIPSIAVFAHQDQQMQVASGKNLEEDFTITRLESTMSFLQIRTTMSLQEKIKQVRYEICQSRRETAFVRLEAIAGADNPYSLLQVFGRGHIIAKSGAVAYVTRCRPVEVLPRMSSNCTEEIPVTWKNSSFFVDPISFVLKTAASPTRCNDIAPPRWSIAGKWYCAYPAIRECAPPQDLPVDLINIDDDDVLDLGLGRSIYSKEQVEEFLAFQDSQGTRRAYLAETAELAYSGRAADGTWGLAMGEHARAAIIDAVGLSFIPLYWVLGPATATILFLMFAWGFVRLVVTILMRAFAIYRMKGAGVWILGAVWSLPFQLLVTPFKWASGTAADVADRIGTEMECRALHEDEEKGGGYPTAALERLGESQYPPFNPSFMAVNKDSD